MERSRCVPGGVAVHVGSHHGVIVWGQNSYGNLVWWQGTARNYLLSELYYVLSLVCDCGSFIYTSC